MNRFVEHKSGLVIPAPKLEPPKRTRPPLEIQNDDRREKAKEALSMLWDTMELSEGGGIVLPGQPKPETRAAYYQVYRFIGEMLLGDECPEHEMLT